MDFDVVSDLNWLAVIVATLAYFALGALWYSPVAFGNRWMKAAGMSMEGEGPGPAIYLAPLVFCFLSTFANAMLAEATGSNSVADGIVLGLVVSVGYALSLLAVTAVFESNKPNASVWGAITAGYHIVGLLISAIIVSAWD
ncbi:MAG: DUF1761 domain-containing protein [Actinomycetota bacterium]